MLSQDGTGRVQIMENDNDFSIVLGGPLYQLYLRTRLTKPPLGLLARRVIIIPLVCWLPLLLLCVAHRNEMNGTALRFVSDVEAYVRFLVVVPLLIIAELVVHQRLAKIVRQFVDRDIVRSEELPRFSEIIKAVMRLRNSVVFEVLLLIFCFTIGDWVWKGGLSYQGPSWYAAKSGSGMHLTAAGYWYEFVSLPIFRFLLFRWYFRLSLWYLFLWRTRGLQLHLNLFHPDRAGGLGFLAGSIAAFMPVLVAHTTFMAGFICNRILHAGATLLSFKMEIVGSILFLMLLVLAPLTFFVVHLERSGRVAGAEYGVLASHYVDEFRKKWIEHRQPKAEALLGTSDLQSLADLGNAYATVSRMRPVPFDRDAVIRLAAWLVIPLLPLVLTIVSPKHLVDWLIKLVL